MAQRKGRHEIYEHEIPAALGRGSIIFIAAPINNLLFIFILKFITVKQGQ